MPNLRRHQAVELAAPEVVEGRVALLARLRRLLVRHPPTQLLDELPATLGGQFSRQVTFQSPTKLDLQPSPEEFCIHAKKILAKNSSNWVKFNSAQENLT